jgi:hypothetical protein
VKVIGIPERFRVHTYANVSDPEYLYELSRNLPKERRQRGCSGSAMRKYKRENRDVPAKSFNPCNSRLLVQLQVAGRVK